MENLKETLHISDVYKRMDILHSETIKKYDDGIEFLIENKDKTITYNHTDKFIVSGDFGVDDAGLYFYEYCPNRDVDIINNIRFESTGLKAILTYRIGNKYQSDMEEFLCMFAAFHIFKIRITFLVKPSINDEFMIHYKGYIIEPETKKILAKNKAIITNTNRYEYGFCYKRDDATVNSTWTMI